MIVKGSFFLWYTHLVIETTSIFRLDDPETTAPTIMISSPRYCQSRLNCCFEVQLRSLRRMTLWPLRGLPALFRHLDSPGVFSLQGVSGLPHKNEIFHYGRRTRIVPALQTIVKNSRIRSQHHHQVYPALRKDIADVPIEDVAALLHVFLNFVEKLYSVSAVFSAPVRTGRVGKEKKKKNLVFVNDPAFQLVIVAIVATLIFNNLIYREVLKSGCLGEKLTVA